MTNIRVLLHDLCAVSRKGYDRQLPGEYDSKFMELADHYAQSNELERTAIRDRVEDECRLFIIGFSDRLAIIADRTGNKRLLLLALLAHSIEDFRYDDRENIIHLALVNHIAEKMNQRPSELFEKAAQLSSLNGAKALRAFINRPPELKSLRTMGIIEEQTDGGVDYRYR